MGVVETLVHTHDVAAGLGLTWTPPAGLCARALARLFPGPRRPRRTPGGPCCGPPGVPSFPATPG